MNMIKATEAGLSREEQRYISAKRKKNAIRAIAISTACAILMSIPLTLHHKPRAEEVKMVQTATVYKSDPKPEQVDISSTTSVTISSATTAVQTVKEKYYGFTKEEIELIALVATAESGGESELGQRLVIDTILNRKDHEHFPNTINGVIYQKNAFSPVENKTLKYFEVTDEMRKLVKEEIKSRTNTEVLFFRTKRYHRYGEPVRKVGGHHFSTL